MLSNYGWRHTLRIFNIYCISTQKWLRERALKLHHTHTLCRVPSQSFRSYRVHFLETKADGVLSLSLTSKNKSQWMYTPTSTYATYDGALKRESCIVIMRCFVSHCPPTSICDPDLPSMTAITPVGE